jgi:hypothetical protein
VADSGGSTLFKRIATPLASSRPGAWFYVNIAPTSIGR